MFENFKPNYTVGRDGSIFLPLHYIQYIYIIIQVYLCEIKQILRNRVNLFTSGQAGFGQK